MTARDVTNIQGGLGLAQIGSQIATTGAQVIGGITFGKEALNSQNLSNTLNSLNEQTLSQQIEKDTVNNQNVNTLVNAMIAKSSQNSPAVTSGGNKWIIPAVVTMGVLGTVILIIIFKNKKRKK